MIALDVEVASGSTSWEERARVMIKNRRVVVRVEHHIELEDGGIVHTLNVRAEPEARRGV